jgi:6-phosphogluconolactonase (cycloisomerase 2 family)
MRTALARPLAVVLLLALGAAIPARAAGPILVTGNGEVVKYDPGTMFFNPDQGPLGLLDNATAVADVAADFAVWEGVATATVAVADAGPLPEDVTVANVATYFGLCNGLSPVVFDTDGSLTDYLLGSGASDSILGFAGLECGEIVGDRLVVTESYAFLNGRFVDGVTDDDPEVSLEQFNGVFIHEFGHYLGIEHSQVNLEEAFDDDLGNDELVPTMFPFFTEGNDYSTLALDDRVAISALYPTAAFATDYGTIDGSIFRFNGIALFQGAYVVAREVGDPRGTAVGVSSGDRYFPEQILGPPPPELKGRYTIPGLPPGTYTVEVVPIDPRFVGGSSVGPFGVPPALPGPSEFWNANEASTDPPDDPADATPLAVSAGATESGIDVILNADLPQGPVTGLASIATYRDGKGGVEGIAGSKDVAASPDGRHVYALGSDEGALQVFARDAATGALTPLAVLRDGDPGIDRLAHANVVTVSADGAHVYVGTKAGAILAFARDAGSGLLAIADVDLFGLQEGPSKLVVSPDGANVYAPFPRADTILVLSRNPATGQLIFVQALEDGIGGVTDLDGVSDIVVSPDGAYAYAAGPRESAVVLFARDADTGALTELESFYDRNFHHPDGTDGLGFAGFLALSPDGLFLYVGHAVTDAFERDGLGVFARNPTTGELSFVQDDVAGLVLSSGVVASVTVTPDGAYVLATTSSGADSTSPARWSVMLLERDQTTGKVRFVGVEDLEQAVGIAVSPDSAHVYVGSLESRVGAFRLATRACAPAPLTTCQSPALKKSRLLVKDPLPPEALEFGNREAGKKDQVIWKWRGGAAAAGAFGDPAGARDDLVACLYDASIAPQPVTQMLAAAEGSCGKSAKPCWKVSGSTPGERSFKMKDTGLKPHGIKLLKLKEGAVGRAKITLKAQKYFVPTPLLPLALPVTMQLQAATGECWEAVFDQPKHNDPDRFDAETP